MSGFRVPPALGSASQRSVRAEHGEAGAAAPSDKPRVAARSDCFDGGAAKKAAPRNLSRGVTGSDVLGLQMRLQMLGAMPAADVKTGRGVFGPRTQRAVMRFQEQRG